MKQAAYRREKLLKHVTQGEGMVITQPKNIFYLTGFDTDPHERFMGLCWNGESWTLILPQLDQEAATQVIDGHIQILGYRDDEPASHVIQKYIQGSPVEMLWIEESVLTYERVRWLLDSGKNLSFKDLTPILHQLRMLKSDEEISALKEASQKTDHILQQALAHFTPRMTEIELVAEIEYQAKRTGATQMSFNTTVLGGHKSALPHGNAGKRLLDNGVMLIDFGIVYNGYCSDMTRTFHIGEWENQIKEVYDVVLEAEELAITSAKPGMTFEALDQMAREYITEHGYGEYFIHRLGHGMGIEVHEAPSIGKGNLNKIEEGMVFTIEPGVYVPERGGVRIEDAVYVTLDGAKPLTSFPKKNHEVVLKR
ncbi:M24 family metallopeptidase [Caldalkalibacillus salinus]|uniref:M24 family metallopeptidase n=1 Tax=Caldalkalibacillus salinus TaxID=2803787 RepID=UPI001924BC21|nr:Xaa-Pro peptidase family protein [Caldalkalibacillus salinus]